MSKKKFPSTPEQNICHIFSHPLIKRNDQEVKRSKENESNAKIKVAILIKFPSIASGIDHYGVFENKFNKELPN